MTWTLDPGPHPFEWEAEVGAHGLGSVNHIGAARLATAESNPEELNPEGLVQTGGAV